MSKARSNADQISVIDTSAANATAITIDASENVTVGGTITTSSSSTTPLTLNCTASGSPANYMTFSDTGGATGYFGFDSGTNDNLSIYNVTTSGAITAYTNSIERMRIDSSGNLLVGKTTTTYTTDGVRLGATTNAMSTTSQTVIDLNRNGTDGAIIGFYNDGSNSGSISISGSSTAYNTSSDYRLKQDWQPMTGATERLMSLNPVNFAWKADGTRVDGFLAHEAQAVVPEAVHGVKDEVDDEGNPVYQGIDQSKLVPLLVAALQELRTEFDAYKASHP